MSNLPPLALPRFHVNALSQAHKNQMTPALSAPEEKEFAVSADAQPDHTETDLEAEQADIPVIAPPPEIDTGTILNSLEAAVSGLQKTALSHSQNRVAEFLQAAFPSLCEAFLADEVVRATDAMMPNEIERLVLKVPAAFAPAFQRAIQASPTMTGICDLQTVEQGDGIVIDVDWRSGGLLFDMDQFLESSLARLAGPTHTQEGHNV